MQDNNDDTNKENQNNSNIPSRKENRKNSDSFNLILKETNFLSSNIYKYKSKTPTILKNPCSSPKFLGGLTSPSGQGLNIPKGNTTNLLHEEYALETRIRPYKGEMDLKFQNARNRYSNTKTNNIHMVNKSKRYENKPAETLSLRKSMSLEDLRLAQKAEPENKGSSRNTHEAKKLG